jgi:AcrR family transcriptional regulator
VGRVTTTAREPRQERSRATRQRLLEATVACLVEHGWSGATTTVIAERAGVSRGAQLHHYPTRASLVLAAVTHLADKRGQELRADSERLTADGQERVGKVIDLLATAFTGPLFVAALEVWMAARTDPELRERLIPVEARVGREMHRLTVEMLGADENRPGVREAVQVTLDLLRGLGVVNLLNDDTQRRNQLLSTWKQQLTTILRPEGAEPW